MQTTMSLHRVRYVLGHRNMEWFQMICEHAEERMKIDALILNINIIAVYEDMALFQYPIRRHLIVIPRDISKPRNLFVELTDCSDADVSVKFESDAMILNYQSPGFEIWPDLMIRFLTGLWNGAQMAKYKTFGFVVFLLVKFQVNWTLSSSLLHWPPGSYVPALISMKHPSGFWVGTIK